MTPLLCRYSIRFDLVDKPDGERKVHSKGVPRIGGIAVFLAYLLSFSLLGAAMAPPAAAFSILWRFAPGTSLIFALGLYDDIWGLKARHKLFVQLIAALMTVFLGIRLVNVSSHHDAAWWTIPATILWLVVCTNAINLIDGLDGLATGIGIFATATIIAAAAMQGDFVFAAIGVPLLGALLGFLRFNTNPASIFLGDCGSLPIGFFLGCYSAMWSQQATTVSSALLPFLALAVPLIDVVLTIARRFLKGQPIFCPDRGHVHHRLLARGHSTKATAMLLYAAAIFFSLAALCMHASNLQVPCILVTVVSTCYMVRYLNYAEFSIAQRTLGSFRRLISARLLLHTLETQLRLAKTPEDCWTVLRISYRAFGFHEIILQYNGEVRVDRCDAEQSFWRLEVPLSAGNFLSFRYSNPLRLYDDAIGGFVFIVRNAFSQAGEVGLRHVVPAQTLAPVVSRSTTGGV